MKIIFRVRLNSKKKRTACAKVTNQVVSLLVWRKWDFGSGGGGGFCLFFRNFHFFLVLEQLGTKQEEKKCTVDLVRHKHTHTVEDIVQSITVI